MIDPKWLVIGGAAVSLALIFNYDLRLGVAASVLFVVAGAIFLGLRMWLGSAPGSAGSTREALVKRIARLDEKRRQAREKDGS